MAGLLLAGSLPAYHSHLEILELERGITETKP
jgi:hypothetical protein